MADNTFMINMDNTEDYTRLMIGASADLDMPIEQDRLWPHIPAEQQDAARKAWAAHQAYFKANPQFAYDPPAS
jgi:hypothetical protein